MDSRLLRHYEGELSYLREMGAEFAAAYPKVASRLGMDGIEVLDPYVERLIEGVAFLTARVQLELELQYPKFTSHLLDVVYPHYLAPTPSTMIAQLVPDLANPALEDGYVVARHSHLRSVPIEGSINPCIYRTAADLTLCPVEITETEYIDGRGALVSAGVATAPEARAAIRLRIKRPNGAPLAALTMDSLELFMGGNGPRGWHVHETLGCEALRLVARSTDRRADWSMDLGTAIAPAGHAPEEALLPLPHASYDGYRLLQEYFALPDRFLFTRLSGLAPAMSRAAGDEIDLYILLRKGGTGGLPTIEPGDFKLNCVPAINLFEKRCDRARITTAEAEQHIVVDRTAPFDFEIYGITSVTGIGTKGETTVDFRPFFSTTRTRHTPSGQEAYYSVNRQMRQRSQREKLAGARSSYLGSEVFLSLIDGASIPYHAELAQLAVTAMVTNRDLPLLLSTGTRDLFHLPEGGPVAHVTTPVAPTRPRPAMAQGETAWRLISHLSLNYLPLVDTEEGTAAAAMRELVALYAPPKDKAVQRQLEGLLSVRSRPIIRRISDPVLSTAVRGLEVELHFDEEFFEGASLFPLACVLERFLRHHVSINSFTETVLTTLQRGELKRWRPAIGTGQLT